MPSSGPKENVVFGLIIGSEIYLVGTFRVRSVLSDSTRSVVFLIKYLVWETAHHNDLASKISSERPSRRFSGCRDRPAARLEWLRRNLKFCCGTLRYRGETGVPTLLFFVNRFPSARAGMMAVIDECAKLAADFLCYPSAAETAARFLPPFLTD
jgi:hypothetical protein